jgi:hypothetical protein
VKTSSLTKFLSFKFFKPRTWYISLILDVHRFMRAKMVRKLEYSELATLAGCVAREATLTWALMGLPYSRAWQLLLNFFFK